MSIIGNSSAHEIIVRSLSLLYGFNSNSWFYPTQPNISYYLWSKRNAGVLPVVPTPWIGIFNSSELSLEYVVFVFIEDRYFYIDNEKLRFDLYNPKFIDSLNIYFNDLKMLNNMIEKSQNTIVRTSTISRNQ